MPTKRMRQSRVRREAVSPTAWAWLTDAEMPDDHDALELLDLRTAMSDGMSARGRTLWEAHRDEILATWMKEKPGIRPGRWWDFDASRSPVGTYPGSYMDGRMPEPRRRTGGTG